MSRPRLFVAVTLTVCMLMPGTAAAAPLTSISWAVNNTSSGATGVQYEWNFTTASSANLDRVTASLPSGTRASSPYLSLPGVAYDRAYTPDRAFNQATGDLDIRVHAALTDWTHSDWQGLIAQWYPGNRSWNLSVTQGGAIELLASTNGTGFEQDTSYASIPVSDGQAIWLRATLDANNGSGGHTTTFYTSSDGNTWTQLEPPLVRANVISLYDSTEEITVGANWSGQIEQVRGNIYYASVLNGINGSEIVNFDPSRVVDGSNSWTGSLGETWTVNQTSSFGADVVSNLSETHAGLPAGTAVYRYRTRLADYKFTSTSFPASTNAQLRLSGFTNTSTIGSYSSTVTTYQGSAVDTGATGQLMIGGATETSTVSAEVLPSMTFSVQPHAGSCNGVAQTLGASVTSNSVGLGRINIANGVGAQDLSIATNSAQAVAYARSTGAFASTGYAITTVSGTNATPVVFPTLGNEAFGYTTDDATLVNGVDAQDRFTNGGAKWAALTGTNAPVMQTTGGSETNCVAYQAGASPTTPAGSYSITVLYTAVASF